MPVMSCSEDGKSGWKYGNSGKCYTYPTGDKKASGQAKLKAYKQGAAITGGTMKEVDNLEQKINSMNDLEIGAELFVLESKLTKSR